MVYVLIFILSDVFTLANIPLTHDVLITKCVMLVWCIIDDMNKHIHVEDIYAISAYIPQNIIQNPGNCFP